MVQFIILDQTPPKHLQGKMKIITDPGLWKKYLDEICRLRGKIYVEEGLYSNNILTKNGKFEEKWDPISMHVIAVDDGKIVGGLRVTLLSENGTCYEAETEYLLQKLNLKKHAWAFHAMLDAFTKQSRKVIEITRLVVAEEYRRFRNAKSMVSIGLFTITYSYFVENKVTDVFIVQGNKYKTGHIYDKIGFSQVEDINGKLPLEPFYEYDDICSLMYFNPKNPSEIFLKFINRMNDTYLSSTIIAREEH